MCCAHSRLHGVGTWPDAPLADEAAFSAGQSIRWRQGARNPSRNRARHIPHFCRGRVDARPRHCRRLELSYGQESPAAQRRSFVDIPYAAALRVSELVRACLGDIETDVGAIIGPNSARRRQTRNFRKPLDVPSRFSWTCQLRARAMLTKTVAKIRRRFSADVAGTWTDWSVQQFSRRSSRAADSDPTAPERRTC